jgi:hypothetical protein
VIQITCPSLIYVFWLSFWYLQTFGPCITCPSLIYDFWILFWCLQMLALVSPVPLWFTASDYPFWNFNLSNCWPLYHLSLRCKSERDRWYKVKSLKIPKGVMRGCKSERDRWAFGIFKLLTLVSPVPLWFTASHYPFWNLQTFGPCFSCPSLIYTFSLPLQHFEVNRK